MQTAYIIFNPYAGRFPTLTLTERDAEVLSDHNWDTQLVQTSGSPEIADIALDAVWKKRDAVFVVGDDLVNLSVAGLTGSETALGELPARITNVWAQELGLPGLTYTRWIVLEESAHRQVRGRLQKVDVGYCNERPFLMWSGEDSMGLLGITLIHVAVEKNIFRMSVMVHELFDMLVFLSVLICMQLLMKNQISARFCLAVISNIHLYAGRMAEISLQARLDDKIMDLWLFTCDTFFETVQHTWNLFSGRHLISDQVRCIPFRNLRLSSDQILEIQLDDEPVAITQEVKIDVHSTTPKILAPLEEPKILFAED